VTVTEKPLFCIERLGVIMEPDPNNPDEAWGVLNPAAARSRNGELYIFPRVVAEKNYSRIGIAKVIFDDQGDPKAVERLGYVLEPTASYEKNPRTAGCEDPRINLRNLPGQICDDLYRIWSIRTKNSFSCVR